MIRTAALFFVLFFASASQAQTKPNEGDFVLRDFLFASGERMDVKQHYATLGTPVRNASGAITNAVLLLHGTSGTGTSWLIPSLAPSLFGPGAPLDTARFYVILPDGIGRGGSSKPSDGLRTKFPHYRYADMVNLQYRLLTEGLGVSHVRLVMGASMGGMQSWMWPGMYPDFMDAAVPIASQPVRISGRNWISRRIAIDAIRNDPDWQDGNYTTPPTHWVITAPAGRLSTMSVSRLQEQAPDTASGDALYRRLVDQARRADANDALYATEAVMDYAPEPLLGKIRAKLLAINFADDAVNPAELGNLQPAIDKIPGARAVILPAGPTTAGHYTYELGPLWVPHLAALMQTLE